jgi:4-amino-4-deoxy-L-arabinose transferase-like glycosyltransferase
MNEPSVLDYLKSKLGMGEKIDIPRAEKPFLHESAAPAEHALSAREQVAAEPSVKPAKKGKMPLSALFALFFALMGQAAFEPSVRDGKKGLILYAFALLLLAFAYLRQEWRLPPLQESESRIDPLSFNIAAFIAAIVLSLAAFATFANNAFNFLNTVPWLLSLLLFVWSLWLPESSFKYKYTKIKTFFTKREWHFSITREMLLVLLISAVILFFRLYQTATVPAEPFSDHAEKILDVYDVSQGEYRVFFPRNTGREAIQMYWTLLVAKVFGTGLSFLSLKLGTALLGLLTLPYVYLLGKEVANKRVGLIAFFLMGISYWHNVISRVGLRFPLYPLFVAPVLYYLLRGIRRQRRNDFILAGLFLGLGSHGYSPYRIMPVVVVAAVLLYALHKQSKGVRKQVFLQLVILALLSVIVFLPLGRYALEHPDNFSVRAISRLGDFGEGSLQIFADNFWDGILMLNWDNGGIWVHSVAGRPALGVVSGALFVLGTVLLLIRYFRRRHWLDLFLILSVLLLQLPSTLSIAFPEENPALNRAGGAAVVVFVIAALAADGLLTSLRSRASRRAGLVAAWGLTILLAGFSIRQNYDLVFNQYADVYRLSSWNSSEMGEVIQQFEQTYGQTDTVWIVPYMHWVDTRLPGVWAGIPNRDFALWQKDLAKSLTYEGVKLFMVKPEDEETLKILTDLYPNGTLSRYTSDVLNHDFMLFFVP